MFVKLDSNLVINTDQIAYMQATGVLHSFELDIRRDFKE